MPFIYLISLSCSLPVYLSFFLPLPDKHSMYRVKRRSSSLKCSPRWRERERKKLTRASICDTSRDTLLERVLCETLTKTHSLHHSDRSSYFVNITRTQSHTHTHREREHVKEMSQIYCVYKNERKWSSID